MSEILRGLQPKPNTNGLLSQQVSGGEDQTVITRDTLRTLRQSVLSGEYNVKVIERNGLERLCLLLPLGNISQKEATDMIRQAAARGEIELPDALSTSDGAYDADTMIFNLVQTSLANDGTLQGAEAAREMSRRAFAASEAKTRKVNGQRLYVVEPGDSLAYISLQFYGRPSDYLKIFEANRSFLNSPIEYRLAST